MNCTKCNAQVSPIVAAETAREIRTICESYGFKSDEVEVTLKKGRPLCRTCMRQWGTDEGDLAP